MTLARPRAGNSIAGASFSATHAVAGVQAAAAYGFSGSDGRRFIHLPHSS